MRTAAMNASGSVTGSRLTMSRPTGTSYWRDTPRSPRSALVSHSTYWRGIGRFSPSASRSRAAASGLPSGPMITSAGSPGSTRTTTNTSSETTRRVTTKAAARLAMYPRTLIGSGLFRPRDLGEIERRQRQILPEPLQPLLGDGQPRVDVEPHHRCILDELLLHPHVELAARLVVDRHLRLLEELLELGAVVAEVVGGLRVVGDVPRLGVADDGQVVLGVLPHARQPLAPLDLLDLDLHTDLPELAGDHLAGPHRVVVLGRDLQHGLEPVRVAGLGQQLLGPGGIVRHRAGHVDEVGVERIDVRPEHAAEPEHRAPHHLGLVDPVGDGPSHPDVAVRLARVVHRHDHVVGRLADDDLEPPVLLEIRHVLGADAEHRRVDVARLERGQRGVRVGDEAVRHPVQLGEPLDVILRILHQHDAVAPHHSATLYGPVPIGSLFSVSTPSRGYMTEPWRAMLSRKLAVV